MNFNMKTIATITTSDELVYPFSLQAVGDVLVHRLKNTVKVARLKKDYYNRESKIQLTSIKTEKPTQFIRLPVNQKKVFDNADWNQKNLLMFNAYLLPDCTLKNTHYVKSRLTGQDSLDDSLLAALTTAGIIEVYRYNLGNHQLFKLPIDLSELQKEGLSRKEITKYETLVTAHKKVSFTNLEWCPLDFKDFKLLTAVTKSDEILIYSIYEDRAVEQFKLKSERASINEIKWTYSERGGHNLYVGMENGNLKRFSLKVLKDGRVESNNETEEIAGKIKVPCSNIYVDYFENDEIIICCKSHSLEIIHMTELKLNVINKYIGVSITGFDNIGKLEYIVTTLNSNIFYVKLTINVNRELEIQQFQKIEITLPSEDEVQLSSSKMSYYGVATSKNKVFVYISSTPHHSTDHLLIKQPVNIFVNVWPLKNPYEILKNNRSGLLTDFADCVEAVRLQGTTSAESLEQLEDMNYEIQLDEAFVYYLKVQLLLVNTKMFYYIIRSQTILDIFKNSQRLMMELIKVVKTYLQLEKLLKADVNVELNIAAIQAMKKFLIGYSRKIITTMPFKEASVAFKPIILDLVNKCKLMNVQTLPEKCQICEELIFDDEETCSKDHQMKRCAITNLLVALDSKDYCSQCSVSVTSFKNLKYLFEHSNHCFVCPFCDVYLTFSE